MTPLPLRIETIDCDYVQPRFAAAYLLIAPASSPPATAFIDNNTRYAVPRLLAALQAAGQSPGSVQWIIVTHVHLDHAAGTAELLKHCPNARVLAHPRAARHLIDPTRLVASARAVYGAEIFDKLYGQIDPIDAARVDALEDGATRALGDETLRFLHTRGHANHHFCVLAQNTRAIFTGDAFGLAYPALQNDGLFLIPSTSPTDFDAAAAIASAQRIAASGATTAYPTHFGPISDPPGLAAAERELTTHLQFARALVTELQALIAGKNPPDTELETIALSAWQTHIEAYAHERGLRYGAAERAFLKMDLKLNADGLVWAAKHPPLPPKA